MSAPNPTYDELRVREELDLAAQAASVTAARSHQDLARLYLRRIAEAKTGARPAT
jgi:hypothetical protein